MRDETLFYYADPAGNLVMIRMTGSLLSSNSHWHRLRWQILWGLSAAAIPPLARLLYFGKEEWAHGLDATINASWGGLVAIFLGIFLVRNVGRYPGVEKAAAIIPSFSAAFGALVVALLMLRFDYSRWVLAGSYFCSIVIFYLGHAQVFGRKQLTIGVVPGVESTRRLTLLDGVNWKNLRSVDDEVDGLEAVAVDLRVDLPVEWERRIADFALSGIPVYHSKHLLESLTGRVELEHLSESNFGTLSPRYPYMVSKHVIDWIAAAVALLVLWPFMIAIGLLIRLDSRGPAIFKQQRIGFRGNAFTVYKFRTMRIAPTDASGERDAAITRSEDDRVTKIGRVLRQARLDELPQIMNILRGQMSWIGPRPEATILSSWYEAEIPFYRYRHVVRPGITGWAQVMQGHVADVEEVRSKLYYDFYYIKNFSFWIDSLILFKTVTTMLNGFGAK